MNTSTQDADSADGAAIRLEPCRGGVRLILGGALGVRCAARLFAAARDAAGAGGDVALSCAGVVRTDSAALQILLALAAAIRGRGAAFELADNSAGFEAALVLSGLPAALGAG